MRLKLKTKKWLIPLIIGIAAVLIITGAVFKWGARPAIAPGTVNHGPLLQSVNFSSMVREYRGWLEVKVDPVITIKAPNAVNVKINYWLADQTTGEWHSATRQADGTWSLTWPLKEKQQGHMIVQVIGQGNEQEQTDTYNVLGVKP